MSPLVCHAYYTFWVIRGRGSKARAYMQLQTRASSIFFKYSISIVTRQCYFRTGVLFVRLQPYRSTDLTEPGPIAETRTIFFSPHRARGQKRNAGRRIELRRLTDIDLRARSRELWKTYGRSSFDPATLGNPFDRAIDNQADERHVTRLWYQIVTPHRNRRRCGGARRPELSADDAPEDAEGGTGVHYFSKEPRGAKWRFITDSWTSAFPPGKVYLKTRD